MPVSDESRFDDLERRVAALEVLAAVGGQAQAPQTPDLRQLDDLRNREGPRYERGSMRGPVRYAGFARLDEEEVLCVGEHGLAQIWDLDFPAPPAPWSRGLAPRSILRLERP